jgi:hypothetical protein
MESDYVVAKNLKELEISAWSNTAAVLLASDCLEHSYWATSIGSLPSDLFGGCIDSDGLIRHC